MVSYTFPGKISNIFKAHGETRALLDGSAGIEKSGVLYAVGRVCMKFVRGLEEPPRAGEGDTGSLGPRL